MLRPTTPLQLAAFSFLMVLALSGIEIIPAVSETVGATLFIVVMALVGVIAVSFPLAAVLAMWNWGHRALAPAPAQAGGRLRHAH